MEDALGNPLAVGDYVATSGNGAEGIILGVCMKETKSGMKIAKFSIKRLLEFESFVMRYQRTQWSKFTTKEEACTNDSHGPRISSFPSNRIVLLNPSTIKPDVRDALLFLKTILQYINYM